MNEDNTNTSKELGKTLLVDNNTALVGYQESMTSSSSLKEDFLSGAIMITSETDEEKLQKLQEKHKGVKFITPEQAMALIKGEELTSFKGKETRELLSELKKQAYEITHLPHADGIYHDGQSKRRNRRKNKRNPSVYELLKKKNNE